MGDHLFKKKLADSYEKCTSLESFSEPSDPKRKDSYSALKQLTSSKNEKPKTITKKMISPMKKNLQSHMSKPIYNS